MSNYKISECELEWKVSSGNPSSVWSGLVGETKVYEFCLPKFLFSCTLLQIPYSLNLHNITHHYSLVAVFQPRAESLKKWVKWVLQETCRNLFHHWSIWGSLCVYEYANVSIILLWHYFILTYTAAKNTVQSCDNTAAFEKIFTIELNVHMLVYTALFSRKDVTFSW